MASVGDSKDFLDLFPDELIPDILRLVIGTWRKFPKPESCEKEVTITRNLCLLLQREKNFTDLPFKIRWELPLLDSTTGDDLGRADLIFDFLGTQREEVYFLFECKRLCVRFPSGWQSLAGEYVGDGGMMCFMTGKYSMGLPAAGMIGYVMDGNVNKAVGSVRSAVKKNHVGLCLPRGKNLEECKLMPKKMSVKQTNHDLSGREFTIYHLFLKA